MLEEKKSPYNIYINPTEESHRQQIWDITYNWRYDNHMVNDVYGQYESIFEFRCPNYSYRLELSSNEDRSIYKFEVKFDDPPHKMFEDLIAIPQYSFTVTFNEDGNIKEMYMNNIRPSNVPIYPKDPVWKLFTTIYELFDKEPEEETTQSTEMGVEIAILLQENAKLKERIEELEAEVDRLRVHIDDMEAEQMAPSFADSLAQDFEGGNIEDLIKYHAKVAGSKESDNQ